MKFLAKSRIATALLVVAASSALFAQNSAPDKPQNRVSIPDARHIIGQSVVATERSLEARDRSPSWNVIRIGAWIRRDS